MSRNLHAVVLRDPHDRHMYVWRLVDMDQVVAWGRARLKKVAIRIADKSRELMRRGDQGSDYS